MSDSPSQPEHADSAAHGMQRLKALTQSRSWQWRYGMAACVVFIAFGLRLWMFGGLDNRLPFGFFLLAVMIVAWYGGLGPGLFAAAVGLLLASYFFMPRPAPNGGLGEAERTSITVYVINSTLVSFLMDNLHARIRKLKAALKKACDSSGAAAS